jgi:exo-1,4-beta-D-glucosaminidase
MNQLRPLRLGVHSKSLRHPVSFACRAWLFRFALGSLLCLFSFAGVAAAQDSLGGLLELKKGWSLQSSAKVVGNGATFSRPGFASEGWYTTSVPTTVVGALVDFRAYPDPYFSDNLRHYPGMSYKVGENFSNEDMAKDSPFRVSWWYRTEFSAPSGWAGRSVWLNFLGINYRANIWVNGQQIAKADDVAGAFRRYEFEIGRLVAAGKRNAVAVEIFPPTPHDLAITFVDWNPMPPDKDMGIWGRVFLRASGAVSVRHPQVETKLDLPGLEAAHLTVRAQVHNISAAPVEGLLRGLVGSSEISQPVTLAAGETKEIVFTPEQFPQLNFAQPRIWWPYTMGTQEMYELNLEFDIGGEPSDKLDTHFGIDQISSEMTAKGHLQFVVNGKKVLIRGGGWTPDMFLHQDVARWEDDFRYVRGMNLNTVRLEGKLMDDQFFDLADRYGIMVMAGWCCCDHWEKWKAWKSSEREVSTASLRDQVLRLRNHPSVIAWLNGSDNPPPADIEKAYLDVLHEVNWPKPIISSASAAKTSVTGPSGVKMTGPYDYVPPDYWLLDTQHGGAFGFNTETSAGAAIPPIDSLKLMLPEKAIWPINDLWGYHAGGGPFRDIKLYTDALERRYGAPKSLADFEWKSQAMAYESQRAMFEAFARNRGTSTGVIQWMLNNAWPSIIWHLYDFYMRPAGGYFGTQKACEPMHVQYSYDDQSIVVVNDTMQDAADMKVTAKIYDLDAGEKYSHDATISAASLSTVRAFKLPEPNVTSAAYFLRLTLKDASGTTLSSNFYWLSTRPDVLVPEGSNWYYMPEKSYADFRELGRIAKVTLSYSNEFEKGADESYEKIHITNPTERLAFLVHLRLTRGPGGAEILPILWDDNYFEILPGETKDVTARFYTGELAGASPEVEVSGWNVASATPR